MISVAVEELVFVKVDFVLGEHFGADLDVRLNLVELLDVFLDELPDLEGVVGAVWNGSFGVQDFEQVEFVGAEDAFDGDELDQHVFLEFVEEPVELVEEQHEVLVVGVLEVAVDSRAFGETVGSEDVLVQLAEVFRAHEPHEAVSDDRLVAAVDDSHELVEGEDLQALGLQDDSPDGFAEALGECRVGDVEERLEGLQLGLLADGLQVQVELEEGRVQVVDESLLPEEHLEELFLQCGDVFEDRLEQELATDEVRVVDSLRGQLAGLEVVLVVVFAFLFFEDCGQRERHVRHRVEVESSGLVVGRDDLAEGLQVVFDEASDEPERGVERPGAECLRLGGVGVEAVADESEQRAFLGDHVSDVERQSLELVLLAYRDLRFLLGQQKLPCGAGNGTSRRRSSCSARGTVWCSAAGAEARS